MGIRRLIFWSAVALASAACLTASYAHLAAVERELPAEAAAARADAQRIQQTAILYTKTIVPARTPFSAVLKEMGIASGTVARVTASAQPVFDLRHLRAGNQLAVGRSVVGDLREIRYEIDSDNNLVIHPDGADFHSEIQTIPSKTETAGVAGEIHGSLFESIVDAGEKPELAMRLAEIFGYDLDFYTDPRPGDTFRLVVEKRVLDNGTLVSYGRILAAEYRSGKRSYSAVLFHDPAGNPAYYTVDGKSMKREFLHSPLKYAAPITSHFSLSRFHPILKRYRPHLGIDYGAPIGTPVQTIGDGRVIYAGRKGGAGNLVEIQHANGYNTYYMHLSRILVHDGERVEQGQRIGLVGMTGLATGPHLDFRIQHHGQFLNFERLALPPSDPISRRNFAAFAAARDRAYADMPPVPAAGGNAVASNVAPASPAAPAHP
ncbi:MAG TPA: peptidoglycan DD-metalloendopeptidase family protein [Verrucomicrobiae bacterium]|nr:peptidoglycan DD-metalloendopeptidase family protein [Verrucomicrobiae bacterium]